jgi:AcrR family transcriptional regulator
VVTKALRWERRPEERPGEILDAAVRVFASRGYRNARLDDVAAEAGVTKGAVYHHFANKEALLVRALDYHLARAFGRIESVLLEEHHTAAERLAQIVRRAFGIDDPSRADVLLLLQTVSHEVPEVYRRWLAAGPMKLWRLIAGVIEAGKANGEFRRGVDGEAAARMLVGGLIANTAWARHAPAVRGLGIDRARLVDSAIELFLASVRAAPAPKRRPRAAPGRGARGS